MRNTSFLIVSLGKKLHEKRVYIYDEKPLLYLSRISSEQILPSIFSSRADSPQRCFI